MDAGDAAGLLPETLFTLQGRFRPCSKYPEWEPAHHPPEPAPASRMLEALDGTPPALRVFFGEVREPAVRHAGHGEVLDGWSEDSDLMHPAASG